MVRLIVFGITVLASLALILAGIAAGSYVGQLIANHL